MTDEKIVFVIVAFVAILVLLVSFGFHEIIEKTFEPLQPDENSEFKTPISSELFSFIFLFGIALLLALKIIQK